MARSLWLLPVALLLAGCPGPLRKPAEESGGPAPELAGPDVPIQPAEGGAARLAPGLAPGDKIVREFEIASEMNRVGETEDLPPGQPLATTLYRNRRYADQILAADAGRPTSVRRTYERSFERSELRLTGGSSRKNEGAQKIEGVHVQLTAAGGEVRATAEELPPGVTEADLDEVLVLDTVALAAFVPGREVAPGESWTVPIERVAEILGKQPPGASYSGRIGVHYARPVLFGGKRCAHLEIEIDLDLADRQAAGVPFAKKTKMILSGEIYYSFEEGRPLYLRATGPTTIEYVPQGEAPVAEMAQPFTLQGELKLTITFERAAG